MKKPKNYAPSVERNFNPIGDILSDFLTTSGTILEIGSGTGQHAAYLAKDFPDYRWQPTDLPENLDGINAWAEESEAENIFPAIPLDLAEVEWPVKSVDAVLSINTVHIISWPLVERLFVGAGKVLKPGGIMYVYGPFEYRDRPLESSNIDFNTWLKNRDPNSGIRKFDEVNTLATAAGFSLEGDEPMPANNRSIWWRKN